MNAYTHHHWSKYINPLNLVKEGLTISQRHYLDEAVISMGRRNFLNQDEIRHLKFVGSDLVRRGVLTSYGK